MAATESDLTVLLSNLDPDLDPDPYFFCTVEYAEIDQFGDPPPFAVIRETEGCTLVTTSPPRSISEQSTPFRRIELKVNSDLNAVGLTAAVSSRLAEHGISANVIAAFHHDHVFVPAERADRALSILNDLQSDGAF